MDGNKLACFSLQLNLWSNHFSFHIEQTCNIVVQSTANWFSYLYVSHERFYVLLTWVIVYCFKLFQNCINKTTKLVTWKQNMSLIYNQRRVLSKYVSDVLALKKHISKVDQENASVVLFGPLRWICVATNKHNNCKDSVQDRLLQTHTKV